MIQNIIFDVYGTLISTGTGSIEATKEIFMSFIQSGKYLSLAGISPHDIYKKWKQYHREHIQTIENFRPEREIFVMDLAKLYQEFGISNCAEKDIMPMIRSLYGRKVFEDTLSSLEQLKSKYRIALGSTTDTEPLTENMVVNQLMVENVYPSESLKVYKPQPEFYRKILEKQAWNLEETVYVGDSYEDDIVGPKKLSMKAILLDRNHRYYGEQLKIKPDAVITSLNELKGVLEIMNNGD